MENVYIPLSAVAGTATMAQASPAFTTGDEPVTPAMYMSRVALGKRRPDDIH